MQNDCFEGFEVTFKGPFIDSLLSENSLFIMKFSVNNMPQTVNSFGIIAKKCF